MKGLDRGKIFRLLRNRRGEAGGEPTPADPPPTPPPSPGEPPADPGTGKIPDAGSDFAIPDQYKEEGWVSKIKGTEDLWSQLSETQKLVGKKTVPFNYDDATPDQIEEHRSTTRPENKEAYDFFPEGANKESVDFVQGLFFDIGLPVPIGKEIAEKFDNQQKSILAKQFDKDSFVTQLTEAFGNGHEKVAGEAINLLKKNLSAEDSAKLDSLPNDQLILMYKLADNIKKSYGVKESDAALGGGAGGTGDKTEVRTSLRKQINELTRRPHTSQEKLALQNQLAATYK